MMRNQPLTLVDAQAGATYLVVTDLVTIKVSGAMTDGAFAVVEVTSPPGGGPPGMHKHPPQETFAILEGEFQFTTLRDGVLESFKAKAGDVVQAPPYVPHLYKNVGATPGRFLAFLSPAGNEQFFAELGLPVADRNHLPRPSDPPDLERLRAITARYQIEPVRAG